MATKKKMLQAAAGNATGGAGLDITDVFSTYLYEGTGSAITITNGIDLAGEGGLVWLKSRSQAYEHQLHDSTASPVWWSLNSNNNLARSSESSSVNQLNSDGFNIGGGDMSVNGDDYVTWTFRKAPKFFDVVTYTGDGTNGRLVSHNLGSVPGAIIVKPTSTTGPWPVYHRSLSDDNASWCQNMFLNDTGPEGGYGRFSPHASQTATHFSLYNDANANGVEYVAYLFAHNDGDGEFGPSGDQDIIKCGSYTTAADGTASIDLGFEPQWVIVKRSSGTSDWHIYDSMRGWANGSNDAYLEPNTSDAEASYNHGHPTATGFYYDGGFGSSDYIYIAIRRGPLAPPESATEVFALSTANRNTTINVGFPLDAWIGLNRDSSTPNMTSARLTNTWLETNSTVAEDAGVASWWTGQDSFLQNYFGDTNRIEYLFRRAPGFFDVVAYTGDGVAGRTVSHNLGVAPEMMIVKWRGGLDSWYVYHSALGPSGGRRLNSDSNLNTARWNGTAPTESVFTVGTTGTNVSGNNYIAYLFASLDGVSKVFSVTKSSGSDASVNCGFSSGPRFVMLKRTDSTGDWYVWDTERGIVAGNDPYLLLNSTAAEVTSTDYIDPTSNGFTIVNGGLADGDYIGYAVA